MTKRQKFVFTSFLLTSGFIGISFLEGQNRFLGIFLLTLLTVILFAWSLREGLGKNATLLVLILPGLFTLGVGLFWFLLPSALYARIPILILYALGIYSLSLTKNIFTVSAIRTIALSRAAKGVGFVLTLFTSFLLFDAILSLRTNLFLNLVVIFLVSFPLFLQGLWTSVLTRNFFRDLLLFSAVFAYCLASTSLLLYFWPVTVIVGSIFLTVGVYVLLGLGQARLEERLFRQTVREYVLVGVLVFMAMILLTNWRG